EVIINDKYVWLPFEQVRHVSISSPKRLRDLMWIPATVEPAEGAALEVLLPGLYAGSSADPSDLVRLGRATEWRSETDGPTLGVGQRLFLIEGADRTLLETREIIFDASPQAA